MTSRRFPLLSVLFTLALAAGCNNGNSATSLNLGGTWIAKTTEGEAVTVQATSSACTGVLNNPLGDQNTTLQLVEGAASGSDVSYSGTWNNQFGLDLPLTGTQGGSTTFTFSVVHGWCGENHAPGGALDYEPAGDPFTNAPNNTLITTCLLSGGSSTMLCTFSGDACLPCTTTAMTNQILSLPATGTAAYTQENHS